MATQFEIFNKLREFGRSLDKASNTLVKFADDQAEETNRAKACLQLRAILSEAKTFKNDVQKTITDTKSRNASFEQFFALCEKQAELIKDDIRNLEEHLAKYGYKRPTENLPEIQINSSENADALDGSEQSESSCGSPQNTSDNKENLMPSEAYCSVMQEQAGEEETNQKTECKEVDFLMTPEKPTTATRLIQNSGLETKEDVATLSPVLRALTPPVTATPMIKSGKDHFKSTDFNTPDLSAELPVQPCTRTPMIKASVSGDSPTNEYNLSDDQSLIDDFPTPPTFATPGLQRYGSKQNGNIKLEHNPIATPPPPSFSSAINLLDPDDIHTLSKPTASHPSYCDTEETNEILPLISQEEFLQLPECLQNQFSIEQVNHLIGKTNSFLATQDNREFVHENELMPFLALGPLTRVFIFLMIKLNYFTITGRGLYKVL